MPICIHSCFSFHSTRLQTHGNAMSTKVAVALTNIYMAAIKTQILSQSSNKPLEWKRDIDDIFSLRDINRQEIEHFID